MVRIIRKRREPLSRWIEDNVRVPSGISAVSGPLKLHPYRAASPTRSRTQRSSGCRFVKSASIGFTHFIVREPSPILVDADRI